MRLEVAHFVAKAAETRRTPATNLLCFLRFFAAILSVDAVRRKSGLLTSF